jgi:hypothetical protein
LAYASLNTESEVVIEQGPDVPHRPDFISEYSLHKVSGQHLLNSVYGVMSRFGINRKAPLALQQLLQNIFATNPEGHVSMQYPEGMLFPHIFPFQEDGAVMGSLPHSFFVNPLKRSKRGGFASLMEHMKVRILDGSLLTAKEPDYISWMFDVIMNYMANFNPIPLAIKKGPEFLT